jgi:hypothetical protein
MQLNVRAIIVKTFDAGTKSVTNLSLFLCCYVALFVCVHVICAVFISFQFYNWPMHCQISTLINDKSRETKWVKYAFIYNGYWDLNSFCNYVFSRLKESRSTTWRRAKFCEPKTAPSFSEKLATTGVKSTPMASATDAQCITVLHTAQPVLDNNSGVFKPPAFRMFLCSPQTNFEIWVQKVSFK